MALRNILREGDPTLLKKSRPVTEFNERLHQLIDDMRETLVESGGVGLAAPQVGVLRRVVLVMDTNKEELSDEEQIIELINPEIVAESGEQTGPEGCLSIPGVYGLVTRPELVKIKAQDRNGEWFDVWGFGLTARAFAHETDHLDGKLFTGIMDHIMTDEEIESFYASEEQQESEL